jgi:hypothetical protein
MCGPDLSTKPVASCRIGPHDSHSLSEGRAAQTESAWTSSVTAPSAGQSAFSRFTKGWQLRAARSRSELSSALHSNIMDRIEALEQRLAELEQRLADVARRQAEGSAAEWHRHRQCRLEILQTPITWGLKLVPHVHSGAAEGECIRRTQMHGLAAWQRAQSVEGGASARDRAVNHGGFSYR